MKLTNTLKDVQGASSLCIKCAGCTYAEWPETYELCPIYTRDACFTFSGGGMMYLVKALADKEIEYSQSIAELFSTCTSCGACDSRCGIIRSQSPYVNPLDIIRLARYEGVRLGFIPAGSASEMAKEIAETGDLGKKSSLKLSAKIKSGKADTVLFAECFHTRAANQMAESASSLLEKIGSPVSLFSEKGCCGSSLYDFGFWAELEPLVKAQWQEMKTLHNKTFVFLNPHCQEFIQKRYPEILPDYQSIKSQHISQLLASAFKEGKLKSRKGESLKVTYHDPCYLGRGLGIYDAPREVISALSGIKLVEMERNKQNSFCCGARATGNYMPDMKVWTAKERIKEFKATGADLLITACPYCTENFRKVLPSKDKNRIMDLLTLADERT
jgi:heterodisulfide reductase subunit D